MVIDPSICFNLIEPALVWFAVKDILLCKVCFIYISMVLNPGHSEMLCSLYLNYFMGLKNIYIWL